VVQEALEGTGLEPVGGTERLLAAASGSSILQSAVEEVTRVSIQVSLMLCSFQDPGLLGTLIIGFLGSVSSQV